MDLSNALFKLCLAVFIEISFIPTVSISDCSSAKPSLNSIALGFSNTHFYRIREEGGSGCPPLCSFENG